MTNPTPLFIIRHHPNTWFRRILGFFVPRWGPTKYGVIDITGDGSIFINHADGIIEAQSNVNLRDIVECINSATDWDQSVIKLPEPEDD